MINVAEKYNEWMIMAVCSSVISHKKIKSEMFSSDVLLHPEHSIFGPDQSIFLLKPDQLPEKISGWINDWGCYEDEKSMKQKMEMEIYLRRLEFNSNCL